MSVLNKGRCARCLASVVEILTLGDDPEEKFKKWLFCRKYGQFCRDIAAFHCKEPPMGISADDYTKLSILQTNKGI